MNSVQEENRIWIEYHPNNPELYSMKVAFTLDDFVKRTDQGERLGWVMIGDVYEFPEATTKDAMILVNEFVRAYNAGNNPDYDTLAARLDALQN